MSELLTGAQILRRTLADAGVEVMFGYPGGAIMPFYDALHGQDAVRHTLVRQEQAAAHAADGYARAGNRVGVCVATSGPGATNLVTGLAAAHMDGSPVLAITGQVARPMLGRDAFQETDVVGVTMPVTKHNVLVRDVADLADDVREAMAIAMEGRPGPVLVDVPKDVQNQKAEYKVSGPGFQGLGKPRHLKPDTQDVENAIQQAAHLIAEAERPLLMIGRGVIVSGAYAEVRRLAERTGMPGITTLLGISGFPQEHPLHLGMPGMHGEVDINKAIQTADLIVGIGLRYPFQRPNTHITSGGLGAMGFAVPAAMGVPLARPDEPVWALSGDGGFQMNMAEIATMVQEGLEVKLAIFNNGYLGMVRQWQQFFHGGRYSSTPIWSPDYVKLAAAYGIPGWRVDHASQAEDALRRANEKPGPANPKRDRRPQGDHHGHFLWRQHGRSRARVLRKGHRSRAVAGPGVRNHRIRQSGTRARAEPARQRCPGHRRTPGERRIVEARHGGWPRGAAGRRSCPRRRRDHDARAGPGAARGL